MVSKIVENAIREGRFFLSLAESLRLLEEYGLPVAKYVYVKSEEELGKRLPMGFPVVLKVDSPDILHKTEFGGVKVGIRSMEELRSEIANMRENILAKKPEARINGFVIQEMVQEGYEVIIGGINDEQFGPVVAFGLGGIFVEVLKDVVFEIAPVTEEQALDMIRRIKGYTILEGYRGRKPADLQLLAQTISKASNLFAELSPHFQEADLNPTFVSDKWVKIVDARFKLKKA